MQQALSFSCSEEAVSVSTLAAQFGAGQWLCASRALHFVYKPHRKHRKTCELSSSFFMQQGTEIKGGISFQRTEKMLKRLKTFQDTIEHCSIRSAGKGLTASYFIHQVDFVLHLQQVVSVI